MKTQLRGLSIKSIIIIWTGGLVACFFVIALAFILSTSKLQKMNSRIFIDSMAIEAAYQLEAGILTERREDLIWRATKDEIHRLQKEKEREKIIGIIGRLDDHSTSSEEQQLVGQIRKSFELYRNATLPLNRTSIEEISIIADNLLKSVAVFKEQNRIQMAQTAEYSIKLNEMLDRWTLWLIVLVASIVVFVSVMFIKWIIQPIYSLSRTADQFGQGDNNARTKVYRNDELGQLCRTFNNMVESVINQQQDRLNFIATVAHDLKNPLVFIGAAARRIKKTNSFQEESSVWLDCIIKQVNGIEQMILDLMDSVQIATGKLNLRMSKIELVSFIRSIQQEQANLIKSHKIVFDGQGACWINGDANRLERVLLNLISNAVKYSPDNSTIYLAVEKKESSVKVLVTDEGVGIPPEEIENLFLPFKRIGIGQDLTKGFGLGLFSVKKIVAEHGGKINVTSKHQIGTTIEITLPVLQENRD